MMPVERFCKHKDRLCRTLNLAVMMVIVADQITPTAARNKKSRPADEAVRTPWLFAINLDFWDLTTLQASALPSVSKG
ncbi:hypothetical protein ATO67_19860 [Agrobacterium bohemicum]|uniref:Uncharacterized protein n=1 Tax=Agrobacterium bohemicum TaxID=2052828 RepID=A0A135P7E5_9HYPH|nr:hypothetical protein ATO67_19860 [Agrobacterium bohemicum]